MQKLKSLLFRYREELTYLLFGGLTTLVNYVVYLGLTRIFSVNYLWATVISWVFAVLFAYFTNRSWVFHSTSVGFSERGREFVRFVSGRLLTLALDAGIMVLFIDFLGLSSWDWLIKAFAQLFVIVGNYVISKLFVFKKPEDK